MEFESQICTTKEQSEQLVALGLKKETADMHHYQYVEGGRWSIEARPSIAGYNNRLVPAWSLHRLIELSGMGIIDTTTDNIYDKVIKYISYLIKCESFNKEYLK